GPNAFGVAGTDTTDTGGATGLQVGAVSGHGGLSPWTVHDTFIAWGRDFKRGVTVTTPASIVDLAPTILVLMRIRDHTARDGRVLQEALRAGSAPQRITVETRVLKTRPRGRYQAALQFSKVGRSCYINKGWRLPYRMEVDDVIPLNNHLEQDHRGIKQCTHSRCGFLRRPSGSAASARRCMIFPERVHVGTSRYPWLV